MLSDGFVWKQLLRWWIWTNHRPVVQRVCVSAEPSLGFHLVIMQQNTENKSGRFSVPSEATFTPPQQQHGFIHEPGYRFFSCSKGYEKIIIFSLEKYCETFVFSGSVPLEYDQIYFWRKSLHTLWHEDKTDQSNPYRTNMETEGGGWRVLRLSELLKHLIMTHSKIKKEQRKRKSYSPLPVAGWSPRLILDRLMATVWPLHPWSDGHDVNSSDLKLVLL